MHVAIDVHGLVTLAPDSPGEYANRVEVGGQSHAAGGGPQDRRLAIDFVQYEPRDNALSFRILQYFFGRGNIEIAGQAPAHTGLGTHEEPVLIFLDVGLLLRPRW